MTKQAPRIRDVSTQIDCTCWRPRPAGQQPPFAAGTSSGWSDGSQAIRPDHPANRPFVAMSEPSGGGRPNGGSCVPRKPAASAPSPQPSLSAADQSQACRQPRGPSPAEAATSNSAAHPWQFGATYDSSGRNGCDYEPAGVAATASAAAGRAVVTCRSSEPDRSRPQYAAEGSITGSGSESAHAVVPDAATVALACRSSCAIRSTAVVSGFTISASSVLSPSSPSSAAAASSCLMTGKAMQHLQSRQSVRQLACPHLDRLLRVPNRRCQPPIQPARHPRLCCRQCLSEFTLRHVAEQQACRQGRRHHRQLISPTWTGWRLRSLSQQPLR